VVSNGGESHGPDDDDRQWADEAVAVGGVGVEQRRTWGSWGNGRGRRFVVILSTPRDELGERRVRRGRGPNMAVAECAYGARMSGTSLGQNTSRGTASGTSLSAMASSASLS
jgi:hypothetical protein